MTKKDDDFRIATFSRKKKSRIGFRAGSGFLLQFDFENVAEI